MSFADLVKQIFGLPEHEETFRQGMERLESLAKKARDARKTEMILDSYAEVIRRGKQASRDN